MVKNLLTQFLSITHTHTHTHAHAHAHAHTHTHKHGIYITAILGFAAFHRQLSSVLF